MSKAPKFKTFAEVIAAWPKHVNLAQDIDVGPNLVNVWKKRSLDNGAIIPPEYWNAMVAAARKRRIRGITLRLLADLAETAHPPIRR